MSESKDSRKRIQADIPMVKKIRLYLWGVARGLTKTEMAERILIDRVSNVDNWQEVIKDLKIEAAIAQMPLQEFVCQLLSKDNEFSTLPLQDIDWLPLLQSEEPSTDNLLKLLEEGNIKDAIAYLKSLKT